MLQGRERDRMNDEKFHIRKGSLSFSTESVNVTLQPGSAYDGSFTIYGPEGHAVNGFVTSSEPAVRLLTNEFSGACEAIAFSVNTEGWEADGSEIVEGEFCILSDNGEYRIPYRFTCRRELPASSLGPVKNLTHFTNLARTNWREAVELFYREDFHEVLREERRENPNSNPKEAAVRRPGLQTLYRALSARKGNEHNVEEFLIAAQQKRPAEFRADPGEISVDLMLLRDEKDRGLVYRPVRVRQNGWGYTRLSVSVSGDFLTADTHTLGADSFCDGAAAVTLAIDPLQLHGGRNYGCIVLTPAYGDAIRIPVTVSCGVQTALRTIHRRQQHEIICSMMQEYLLLRGKKLDSKTFAEHMGHLIRRLQDSDRSNPLTTLYKIHYLLTVHQEKDAVWELQALNRRLSGLEQELPEFSLAQFDLEDDLTYSYRMYLTALCAEAGSAGDLSGQDAGWSYGICRDVIRSISRKQRQNPDNFWIAWLLLYADSDRMLHPQETARALRRQYEAGSRSPILYMEYFQLLQNAAGLLHELGDFELQTLYFAARRGLVTEELLPQINYLSLRRKTFSKKLYRILTMCYREEMAKLQKRELLESICTLLIRGNMTDASCFVWYQRGVEAGLTITRLLDYYMMSLPEGYEGSLPQMVVRYYAYQNTLPWMQAACLYRVVSEHREEYGDFYDSYMQQMDRFTEEQLLQHRMSPDLIRLYQQYLSGRHVLTNEMAEAAVPIVFSRSVQTDSTGNALHVVVLYDHYLREQYAPLHGGTAYLPIYGDHNLVLLEDEQGDRYAASVPFTVTALMEYRRLTDILAPYETDNIGFDLYRTELGLDGAEGGREHPKEKTPWPVSAQNEGRYRLLVQLEEIPEDYKCRLRRLLLDYYAGQADTGRLSDLLQEVQPEGMPRRIRTQLIAEMAAAGLTKKAYAWLVRYGCKDIGGETLLRIVDGMLEETEGTGNEDLIHIAYAAFQKGSYHDRLLELIADCWDGRTEELALIRLALEGFGHQTGNLSSRMLTQLLFTGEYGEERRELILDALSFGADTEQMADVLAQSGHFYYVMGKEMSAEEFDLIGEFGRQGIPLLDICRIAWLKNRSEQSGEIADKALEITDLFLSDLLERRIVFPFFRQFIGILPALQAYADETLVEYRSPIGETPPGRVLYHYAMERGGVRDAYSAREMKEMYEGVYVAGFLLFFGEQMHYYITDDDAEKNIVESGTVGQDARNPSSGRDRFDAINEIAMLAAMGRDTEALSKLEQYSRKAHLVHRLFQG